MPSPEEFPAAILGAEQQSLVHKLVSILGAEPQYNASLCPYQLLRLEHSHAETKALILGVWGQGD